MIKINSPTRVDLAGGTLDCWPLFPLVGDCQTVNLSISIFTGCELVPRSDSNVDVEVRDLNFRKSFSSVREFLNAPDKELNLVQRVVEYWQPKQGFQLSTFSESPVGGGLGGSSSLCISLMKAFSQWTGRKLSVPESVEIAHNIEAKIINSPTGTQDYFPALVPGLHVIHYTAEGARLETLSVDLATLKNNLLLVYTGKSHHSGINNWQVIKSVIEGDKSILAALKEIARISSLTAQVCRAGSWHELPELFRHEFEARIRLTPSFTSPEIETLRKLVLQHGGDAVKICGAGGGGCVLVWAAPERHEKIKSECRKGGFQPIDIQPVDKHHPRLAIG